LRPNSRFVLFATVCALVVLGLSGYHPQPARAVVAAITGPTTLTTGTTADYNILADETTSGGNDIVIATTSGTLAVSSSLPCQVVTPPATTCTSPFTHTGDGSTSVTVSEASDHDVNTGENVVLKLSFAAPGTPQTVTITACQPLNQNCQSIDVNVVGATGGTTQDVNPHIRLTANREVISCGNDAITLTAVAVDDFGREIPATFEFHTNFGTIAQIDGNHATLSVPLAQTTGIAPQDLTNLVSRVSVSAFGVGSEFLNIQVRCFVSVVVTANPNVVECGGRSQITASVRDQYGHVVPGVGFHFATDNGLLIVGPPNTADAEQGAAILQLFPPGSNGGPPGKNGSDPTSTSTVTVSVGTLLGTIEGTVTVQQYCPSSAQTAGAIVLTSSASNLGCGGTAFIGATLKDVKGNPVPDGTEIKFLASSGNVANSVVSDSSGSSSGASSPSTTVSTKGGTVNVIYTATAGTSGPVTISAASGASFGNITLQVNCGAAAPAGSASGIRPPNTGDGGLK
jgi:hypothetical protein